MASSSSSSIAMAFQSSNYFFFSLLFFLLFTQEFAAAAMAKTTANNIGVILDMNSRIGKEQKLAMQIAVQDFKSNKNLNLSIHFLDFNGTSLQTALAAQTLIKDKQVEVILVGLENWQTTALVANIGSQAKVPILSLAASPPVTSAFTSLQSPFLIQMTRNATQEISNITTIIQTYHWRRVIVVYEDDPTGSGSGSNSGVFTLLNEALQSIGSKIECKVTFPSLVQSRMTSKELDNIVKMSIEKLLVTDKCYSRVFIVAKASISYLTRFFEGAKGNGLMGNDSVWITMEAIGDILPALDNNTMLNMEGMLGIMSEFDNNTLSYGLFQAKFGVEFVQNYSEDVYNEPSFHALLAYDAITTVATAIISSSTSVRNETATSKKDMLREIVRCDFPGLTGPIYFDQEHHVLGGPFPTTLVNVVGTSYSKVSNFSEVTWPGRASDGQFGSGLPIPKGWAMPTNTNKMKLGIPVVHNYKNFIDYNQGGGSQSESCPRKKGGVSTNNANFTGFSIELFEMVRELLDYCLPYEFIPYYGSYDDLIRNIHNKTFDGSVGDLTILANRTELVDFTFPYQESGLSIILPTVESYNSIGAWIFLQPFTSKMWLVTLVVFVYTMLIIWVLEHGENSEFRGSWRNQISATLWFAFNSLYFAQRERIATKLARVVVIMWLFVVLVLTTSYTANLTSMLTNERLNQTTVDAEMLKRTNAKVGYDNSSFGKIFLVNLLQFDKHNIVGVEGSFEALHQSFQSHTISAAFIEVVYARLFLNQYCNQYIMTTPVYRYGGLAFAFPKGSPIAVDVSEAILNLTESGAVKDLETKWLNSSSTCASSSIDDDQMSSISNNGDQTSLRLKSFWVLFAISCVTTTICLVASFIPFYKGKWRRLISTQNMVAPIDNNPPIIDVQM